MNKPTIAVVDYGVGNLNSVANMIRRAGAEAALVRTPAEILQAERLVLPGVGAFDACRQALDRAEGVEAAIRKAVARNTPLLGICVGMQLLGSASEEGTLPGLDLIPAQVRRFDPARMEDRGSIRIPHMGWRSVTPRGRATLLQGELAELNRFYFVHSYYFDCDDPEHIAGTAFYGHEFTAAVERGRVYGAQFHPEKSHRFGLALFRNFGLVPVEAE